MNPTPVIDMFSGTGELARAVADGLNEFTGFQSFSDALGLSVSAQRRLAGNAVVRPQARLMPQRGLTAINHERNL